MNKAKVWIDNDNLCLYIEAEINGRIVTHDEWGQFFTKEYVKKVITYYFGKDCEIQYM